DVAFDRLGSVADQVVQRDLNGRMDVWSSAIDVFLENPIFGVGGGSFTAAVYGGRATAAAAPNVFLGVLVEKGLPGLLLFVAILLSLWRLAFRSPPLELRLLAVLLTVWTVAASSLSWENREITWLLWGLCLAQPKMAGKTARGGSGRWAGA